MQIGSSYEFGQYTVSAIYNGTIADLVKKKIYIYIRVSLSDQWSSACASPFAMEVYLGVVVLQQLERNNLKTLIYIVHEILLIIIIIYGSRKFWHS